MKVKEFEVTVLLRNNRLKARRKALGFTQRQMALAIGISFSKWSELETMRGSPEHKGAIGGWSPSVMTISEYFEVPPEELFPEAVLRVKQTRAVKCLDAAEIGEREMIGVVDRRLLSQRVEDVLSSLSKRKQRIIQQLVLDEQPVEEVADDHGVSTTRIRQIEAKALRKLRHPSRSRRLKDFVDDGGGHGYVIGQKIQKFMKGETIERDKKGKGWVVEWEDGSKTVIKRSWFGALTERKIAEGTISRKFYDTDDGCWKYWVDWNDGITTCESKAVLESDRVRKKVAP